MGKKNIWLLASREWKKGLGSATGFPVPLFLPCISSLAFQLHWGPQVWKPPEFNSLWCMQLRVWSVAHLLRAGLKKSAWHIALSQRPAQLHTLFTFSSCLIPSLRPPAGQGGWLPCFLQLISPCWDLVCSSLSLQPVGSPHPFCFPNICWILPHVVASFPELLWLLDSLMSLRFVEVGGDQGQQSCLRESLQTITNFYLNLSSVWDLVRLKKTMGLENSSVVGSLYWIGSLIPQTK